MLIPEFKDPFDGRKGIFLFTTKHLERQLVFRRVADYVYGVNTLALGTLKHGVSLLCYALMGNHLHLLVMGTYQACLEYFIWILHRLSLMIRKRYGVSGVLKAETADVQPVMDRTAVLNEVCYLLRNGYKARIDSPYTYPWAPFEVYFNPYLDLLHGEKMPGGRELRSRFGTHGPVPPEWEHDRGRILNKYFVDYRAVQRLLGSGLALFDRLRRYDLESVVAQSHGLEEQLSFTDAEIQEKISSICRFELHVDSPHRLDRKNLLWLASTLARRFACPKKQIARLLGIDTNILDSLL